MRRIALFFYYYRFVFLGNLLFSALASLIAAAPNGISVSNALVPFAVSCMTSGSAFGVWSYHTLRRREYPLYINCSFEPKRLMTLAAALNAVLGCAVLIYAFLRKF
jgi:hypothetical protein